MRILWDEPKRVSNIAKHGLDFADLDPAFLVGGNATPARGGRIKVIGVWGDDVIAVVLQPLGREAMSVISMRRASQSERRGL